MNCAQKVFLHVSTEPFLFKCSSCPQTPSSENISRDVFDDGPCWFAGNKDRFIVFLHLLQFGFHQFGVGLCRQGSSRLRTTTEIHHHIHFILSQASTSLSISTSPDNHPTPNTLLPAHLKQTLLALRQPQQTLFLQYISPLLSPLHSLLQNIPHAYLNTISLHKHTALEEHTSILTTALNIAAIQDTAARIILFLIPPFVPIEILHRSLCIALLKNTSPGSFCTVHTSCIITRSLLGRF